VSNLAHDFSSEMLDQYSG